jgi:hypothetical protein
MRYRDLSLLHLVFVLVVGCSEDDAESACDPENVVDDAADPVGAVGNAASEQELAVAREFVEAVLIDNDPQAATRFLVAGATPAAPSSGVRYRALSRLSVEGDWVVAESEVTIGGVAQLAHDRFRVRGGRVLEHRHDEHVGHAVIPLPLAAAAAAAAN